MHEGLPQEILEPLDKNFAGWRNWPTEQKKRLLQRLLYDFDLWRLPQQQIPPDSEWRYYVNLSGRGGAKCIYIKTPIFTTKGFKLMQDIEVGDIIYDEKGQQTTVTHTSPIMEKMSYKITFSDGSVIYADGEHRWCTLTNQELKKWNRKDRGYDNKTFIDEDWANKLPITTEDILKTLTHSSRKFNNHVIPLTKPLQNEEKSLPIHPYILGAWIGDGFSSTASICGVDQEIFDEIEKTGAKLTRLKSSKKSSNCMVYSLGVEFTKKLKGLEVLNNKHIPDVYLQGSYDQRLALLQGLMDTDGGFNKSSKSRVIYSTTSDKIKEGICFLINSLGMKYKVYIQQGRLNGQHKKLIYRINFPALLPVFRLPRKLEKIHFNHKGSRKNLHRTIVSVDEFGYLPVKCIAVDSPNSMYLVGESLIPTHNTKLSSEEIRRRALAQPNTRINLIAPTHGDCRDTGLEGDSGVISVCAPGEIKKYLKNQGQIIFNNGSRLLTFSAQEPERLRGKQSHYCFMDEFAAFEDNMQEILTQVQMSNRLGSDPKIYITTTPKPSKILEELIARPDTHLVVAGTLSNPFLATPTIKELVERYANTAVGQQELFGQILTEQKDANWTREMIDSNRVKPEDVPHLIRTVIAVDPSRAGTKRSNEAGIIVIGMSAEKHFYVLRDLSVRAIPQVWAQRVVDAFRVFKASTIAVERSDGDLVKTILKNIDPTLPLRMLAHQRKGKTVRAEPAAQLYQQGRVHHVGYFKELENQMCSKVQGDTTDDDRHDALVYGLKELSSAGGGGQVINARDTRKASSPLTNLKRAQRNL